MDHKMIARIGGNSIGRKLAEVRDQVSSAIYGDTHLPNLDTINVDVPKSGIPGSKQEIDGQDLTFMAANADVSIPSFGLHLVAIGIRTSPRRLNRMIACEPTFRIH